MTTAALPDSGFLPRALVLPRSQDYAFLRARGLRHIERLAHAVWTDYNIHDPGITILELLCYALTDVAARADYPVRDLLAGPPGSGASAAAADFHLAHEVLVCQPVSFDDLRRLLIDLPGVRNAWIERHRGLTYGLDTAHERLTAGAADGSIELNGLFDVYLEYEDFVSGEAPLFRTRGAAGLADQTGEGDYVSPWQKGLEFEAREDALLASVVVYAETAGNVVVRLMHRQVEVARKETAVADAQTAVRITLDFPLQAGRVYRLDGTGTAVKLYRTKQASSPLPPATGPVRILGGYAPGPTPESGRQWYYFFYNWEVAHDSAGLTKGEVRATAVERLHANRNLCEDVINVCDLNPEEVAVCADVELRPDADTEATHAEILYRLHHHVSPVVPFHSIEELLARGRGIDEIFEGPLLDHGFIDGEELRAIRRKCEIRASDIVQVIMDVEGVVAVKSLSLLSFVDGELRLQEEWLLPLSADRFRIAVFSPWRSKLIFYKHGLPYYANRDAVKALFKEKKAADIEAKLKVRRRELAVPSGEWRGVGEYEPIQNELPVTYCVGTIRVPGTQPLRQAQSRQLKAYLMFFEQLLANFLAQLSHVGDLFTWRDVDLTTYFTEQIAGILDFDDLDRSAVHGYASFSNALEAIVETPALAEERRLRFLEHLAARYAEEFDEYSALMRAHPRTRLIQHKRRFLNDYPALSARRGTGFDWRWPEVAANVAGYQRRAYRLLDIEPVVRRRLAGHRFEISDVGTPEAPAWRFELHDEDGTVLFTSITCESKVAIEALLDLALRLGGDAGNYEPATADTHQLVQRCREGKPPDPIGETTAPAVLADVIAYFAQVGAAEGFRLIEHILLRRRTLADPFLPVQLDAEDDCCPPVRDPYSFRVSIVLPSWSPRFRDVRFRRLVEDTLRREAPAHVYPRICWVNHEQMKQLETALEAWQWRLASLAREPAACGHEDAGTRTGKLPLPEAAGAAEGEYADALKALVDVLYRLTNVYPLAQLHDCQEARGDTPQVTLGNTSLGTL